MGKHQVGKAHGHAVQLALGQGGACLSGQQIVLAQGIDRAAGERGQGQPELHLGELGGEGGQGAIQRRQRGVAQGAEPVGHVFGLGLAVAGPQAAAQQSLAQWAIQRGKALVGPPLHLAVQKVAHQRPLGKAVPDGAGAAGRGGGTGGGGFVLGRAFGPAGLRQAGGPRPGRAPGRRSWPRPSCGRTGRRRGGPGARRLAGVCS